MSAILALGVGGLSGAMLALALAPAALWPLAWVALVPLFWRLPRATIGHSLIMGAGFGGIYCALGMGWLAHTTGAGYAGLVLYFTIFYTVAFPVLRGVAGLRNRFRPLLLAAAWVSLDFLVGRLFTGIPWLFAGYSQVRLLPLIQVADVTGVHGVTYLVVLLSAVVAFGCETRKVAWVSAVIWVVLTGGAWIYGVVRLPGVDVGVEAGPLVAVIQPNIPQALKDSHDRMNARTVVETNLRLSMEACQDPRPDLLVWSETMNPYPLGQGDSRIYRSNLREFSQKTRRDFGCAFLLGTLYHTKPMKKGRPPPPHFNSAILFERSGEVLGRYDKLHPIPWAEYIPLGIESVGKVIEDYTGFPMCMKAGETATVFPLGEGGKWSFGALVCFDVIYPRYARRMVAGGARFLVNLTNEAWFGETAEFDQLLAITRFRAVENRIWMVRATNSGISAYINSRGEVEAKVRSEDGRDRAVRGLLKQRIGLKSSPSIYGRTGDVFAGLCIVLSLVAVAARLFGRSRK